MNLKTIKGINTNRENDLKKLNIFSVLDLIRHFPRAYLDLTKQSKLSDCEHNQFALVKARIVSSPQTHYTGARKSYVKVLCDNFGEPFFAIWFNQPYIKNYLKVGDFLFYGRVQNRFGAISIVNAQIEPASDSRRLKGLVPVYKLTGKLTQRTLNNLILSALRDCELVSAIPLKLQQKYALSSLKDAYFCVHSPNNDAEYQKSAARIAIEEYFLLICAFKFLKGGKDSARTNNYVCTNEQLSSFIKKMPFELTEGQKNALKDVYNDLNSPFKMNRLLQGDVGSGKTAVALCAVFMAFKSGFQSAMAAPTEILAYQNYQILCEYFGENNVAFLSGSMTAAQKRKTKEKIKNGEVKIVCGTHAIMQDDVEFKNLTLCICDEQHRFGVRQRSSLSDKGASDILVMSATPIPRTLSLILYGDLDISEIKDKPQGRGMIKTVLVSPHKKADMLNYIRQELIKGSQAYIVCPRIEDDEEGTNISVKEVYEEISAQFTSLKCALLHGKMKESEKQAVMQGFKDGTISAIVSTTVIEVGVDVKNATIMTIFGAQMFGLSQLHQLRGRVGRGDKDSYCFCLIGEKAGEDAAERLKIFKSTSDGFKLAAFDYEMRGGGDFLGARQSGKFFGEIKNLKYSSNEIMFAKKLADEVFESLSSLSELKAQAMKKYAQIQDIVLN